MISITPKEAEVLLQLFRRFSEDYNANSLSKHVGLTHRGTMKILKKLREEGMLKSKQMGKATFYKLNLDDYYTFRTMETLLMGEAKTKANRWIFEFKQFHEDTDVIAVFGSILRTPKKARDIDVLFVQPEKSWDKVKELIRKKNAVLPRRIHPVYQGLADLKRNLQKRDPVLLNVLRRGYIVHGFDKLLEVVRDVT